MAATQQALLMASDNAVTVPEACEADPYYSCGPTNDPYWANVVLMLHMDGTDGATTFVDSSTVARTIVAFSSAQVDTANKKFGTGSGYFPTGTNSYLTTGDGYDMPGDFTVEFWLRLDTVTRAGQILFALTSPSSLNHFYIVAQTNGTASSIGVAVGSATINDLTYDLVVNTWYHIAVARSGSTVTLFKNGVERGTTTTTFSPLSTRVGQVGYEVGTGNSLYGYIDDLRITKGIARYTGNFNIPTAAFPDAREGAPTQDAYYADTVLWLRFEDLLLNNAFVDDSAYVNSVVGATTVHRSANEKAQEKSSAYIGAAWLSVADRTELRMGTGDFYAEAWVYYISQSDNSSAIPFLGQENGTATAGRWALARRGSAQTDANKLVFYVNGSSVIVGTATVDANVWTHLAVSRSGSTVRIFKDGIVVGTGTYATNFAAATGWRIGGSNSGFTVMTGYMDEVRVIKGQSVRTADFTPATLSTEEKPGRTVLSLHADDVVVEDASCYQPKTVTLSGTLGNIAEVTDVESKFGGKSFSVPNSGSSTTAGIIVTDHQDFDFDTGDFTIEMWAYRTANTYYGTLFYFTEAAEFSLLVAPTTGNIVLNYRSSGGTQANISTGVTFPLTTWQHVVVQRRGTNFEFYLNGVLGNTTAITGGASSTVNSTGDFYFGRTNASSALTWAGYIDEVRITKGVARYTTAFTPPAQPNCDSVVPGNIVAVPGTSPLTGMSVVVQQQSIGDQNGAVALSNTVIDIGPPLEYRVNRADVFAGNLTVSSVATDKTVALTGRSVTVSRGTLAVPAYPNLISVSTTTIEAVATGNTAKLTFTFFTDGTYTVVDQALTTRTSGTWIDTAQTNYSIPAISNQYRVVTINIFAGTSYTYSTLPFTLGTSFSVVIQNLASSTLNIFDFQLTISPTSTNPRYAEPYYYGTHRFKAVLSNDMS